MAEYIVTDSELKSVADAIRTKTGGTGELAFPDGFVSAVDEITTVEVTERTAWYRPPDWPDITSLPLSTTNRQAYYTIDKELPGAGDIVEVTTLGYTDATVELGYVVNGKFVVVKTYDNNGVYQVTHSVDLTAVETRFPVIRWTSAFSIDASNNSWKSNFSATAPVVEMYFNGSWDKGYVNESGIVDMKAITAEGGYDFNTSGLVSRGFNKGLEILDVSKCTAMTITSRVLYCIFQNSPSLKVIKFPALEKNSVVLDVASQSDWPTSAFASCAALFELDLSIFDTSVVTSLVSVFDYCTSLRKLDISGWNLSACTKMTNTFRSCTSLVDLITDGVTWPAVSFSLTNSTLLSVDSLVGVIAALPTLEEGVTATLTLGTTNTAKLTEEQIAVATEKGWTVA